MLEQALRQPVMGVALHPYLVGQPYRLRHLRSALQHLAARDRGGSWFTTPRCHLPTTWTTWNNCASRSEAGMTHQGE
jgi:hypothetical protein